MTLSTWRDFRSQAEKWGLVLGAESQATRQPWQPITSQGKHRHHLGQSGCPTKTFIFGNLVEHEDILIDWHRLVGDSIAVIEVYGENTLSSIIKE